MLWQSRLRQRNLPDSHYHYDGDSHYHYDGDSHYHYDGDSHNLDVDEHNLDVDEYYYTTASCHLCSESMFPGKLVL